ncbi:unnamed protein product [Lymnaea stagnalis]|uniref:Uncharacterized protein n=1 Tax=Lymnaea stagnalis TaxID=6523 RepID=A0AAV2HNT8_LYMST
MKQRSPIFVVFALIQSLLGTHGLEITLDGFEVLNCRSIICRSAYREYNVTGRIILEEGEIMPGYILYEYKCPTTRRCVTYPGLGDVWELFIAVDAGKCAYETYRWGCKLISGRTYRHFFGRSFFYLFRLCTVRARMVADKTYAWQTPINPTGNKHVSNELNMSDYKNDSSYSSQYDASLEKDDVQVPCGSMSFSRSGADKIHLPDAVLIILGSEIAINRIVFY